MLAEKGGQVPPGFVLTEIITRQDTSQITEMLASVEINCRRVSRGEHSFLSVEPENDGSFAIVGGGPSIANRLEQIRALDKEGNRIVAMNDAAPYLLDHGINVWACVLWETSTSGWCRVTQERPEIRYLIASRAHPDWFAHLRGREIILWHCRDDLGERVIIDRFDADPVMIAGGTSHALRSFEIGRAMGFRKFHLFGCDGSYSERSHAYQNAEQPGQNFTVWLNGETFRTCHHWVQHAKDLVAQVKAYKEIEDRDGTAFRLVVHGEGFIPAYAHANGILTI